jgi:hypothetical protein
MEMMMSKTNDTSSPALEDHRPLADSELELVSGGLIHEGTHAADGTLGLGAGGGNSWLTALAGALGNLMEQQLQRQQELR